MTTWWCANVYRDCVLFLKTEKLHWEHRKRKCNRDTEIDYQTFSYRGVKRLSDPVNGRDSRFTDNIFIIWITVGVFPYRRGLQSRARGNRQNRSACILFQCIQWHVIGHTNLILNCLPACVDIIMIGRIEYFFKLKWKQGNSMLIGMSSHIQAVMIGGNIYVGGGYSDKNEQTVIVLYTSYWVMEKSTTFWEQVLWHGCCE